MCLFRDTQRSGYHHGFSLIAVLFVPVYQTGSLCGQHTGNAVRGAGNLILDEFNNIGKLGGAADGSDFTRTLSVIRSRRIYVMLAVQSLGQLQNRYPNNLWSEIIGNTDIQLMLGCTDDVSAEYFSARSGDMSIQINSTMTVRQTIAVAQVIPQYRQTQGQGKRRLLTPDEVLRLPNEELLVIIRGHNLLKLNKLDYTQLPMSKEIVRTSIMDYTPAGDFTPVPQPEPVQPPEENRQPKSGEACIAQLNRLPISDNDKNVVKNIDINIDTFDFAAYNKDRSRYPIL